MKYLRLFENIINLINEFQVGDEVVLLYADLEDKKEGFREGQIYTISRKEFSHYPYRIEYNIDNHIHQQDSCYTTWVKKEQIKLATQEDIDAIKYNL